MERALHFSFSKSLSASSSRTEVFCKKGVVKYFAKFTGKRLCQSIFFSTVVGLRPIEQYRTHPVAVSVSDTCVEMIFKIIVLNISENSKVSVCNFNFYDIPTHCRYF